MPLPCRFDLQDGTYLKLYIATYPMVLTKRYNSKTYRSRRMSSAIFSARASARCWASVEVCRCATPGKTYKRLPKAVLSAEKGRSMRLQHASHSLQLPDPCCPPQHVSRSVGPSCSFQPRCIRNWRSAVRYRLFGRVWSGCRPGTLPRKLWA